MNNIYLDYAATSLKHFDIFKEVILELENNYANPSSNHTLGKFNNKLLNKARKNLAKIINALPEEIIFTSGGTEANNMIFNHIKNNFKNGEIIISSIEHSSVKECALKLKNKGFVIKEIEVNKNGEISLNDLKNKITDNTILISVMLVNNETGIIQPIEKIKEIIKEKNILLHSDIVQAYCKIDIDIKKLKLDFASVSAHKIGATNNFGFLYTNQKNFSPLIIGGGQEKGLRSGTSDIFGALVFEKCSEVTLKSNKKLIEIKNYLIKKLNDENISYEINGDLEKSLPNIINIYFHNIQAQRLITFLDINNIYISAGSACNSGNIKPSKVITKMYNENRAENSVRISIGFNTTKEMIDFTISKIKQLEKNILTRG